MGGISPIVLSWTARDQKRARIKALKDGADADATGHEPRQADDMRVRARLLEAKVELERIDALRVSRP